MIKVKSFVLLFCVVFGMIGCTSQKSNLVYIPVLLNNQQCVYDYLMKINYYKNKEDIKLTQLPFDVASPNPIIGLLEMTPDKNRDMQSILMV